LGLTPTLTFAGISLWNFRSDSPTCELSEPNNLKVLLSFTGTKSEEWFYMISTAIEASGGPLLTAMLRCSKALLVSHIATIISCLREVTAGIRRINRLLQRMHEECDPQIFYHKVRPLCAGTKGMAAAGLPNGVFYDEGEGKGKWRQYSGGSNGQSSLIQLFDIFLGVDHNAGGNDKRVAPSPRNPKGYLQVSIHCA
jgi:indoleamine 2,3-dioxygenase